MRRFLFFFIWLAVSIFNIAHTYSGSWPSTLAFAAVSGYSAGGFVLYVLRLVRWLLKPARARRCAVCGAPIKRFLSFPLSDFGRACHPCFHTLNTLNSKHFTLPVAQFYVVNKLDARRVYALEHAPIEVATSYKVARARAKLAGHPGMEVFMLDQVIATKRASAPARAPGGVCAICGASTDVALKGVKLDDGAYICFDCAGWAKEQAGAELVPFTLEAKLPLAVAGMDAYIARVLELEPSAADGTNYARFADELVAYAKITVAELDSEVTKRRAIIEELDKAQDGL